MHTDITNTNTDTLAAGVDIGSGDGGAAKMVKTQADTRNKRYKVSILARPPHSNRRPEPEVVIRVLDTNKRDADTVGIIHLNGVQTI